LKTQTRAITEFGFFGAIAGAGVGCAPNCSPLLGSIIGATVLISVSFLLIAYGDPNE
jgi:hypothetical protein